MLPISAAVGARPSAAELLRAVAAARGLPRPADLRSDVGSGAPTLWQLNTAQTLVVANTSRQASIDDAFDGGRIAATAALTAVHATAATPLFARLICECPAGASDASRRALIEGVAVATAESGTVLAEAQMVEAAGLRFDVLVAGTVRPDRLRGPGGAQPDDVLILASPLGAGLYAAAHVRHKLSDDDRRVLVAHATRSHRVGIALGTVRNVHAVACVGPAGLVAATLSLAMAAGLFATLDATRVPALPRAPALARSGTVAPVASDNWNRDGARVRLGDRVMPEMRALLTDPETSGALLIACKRESVERVLKLCRDDGDVEAAEIGGLAASPVTSDRDVRRWIDVIA